MHRSPWPEAPGVDGDDPAVSTSPATSSVQIRRAKSEAKVSMRAAVERAVVTDTPERLAALRQAEGDLKDAGTITELVVGRG